MANTIIHKHSKVVINGNPKLPDTSQLDYGEIAINFADGHETVSFKNDSNKIVEIKPKDYFDDKIDVLETSLNNHKHGTITLSGDVTGSATIGSGTTAINITATVKADSHNHKSSNITDSIANSSEITSDSTELVQGKAVYDLVTENISNLLGDIENNELVVATAITELDNDITEINNILDTKSNIEHIHVSSDITDTISKLSDIKSTSTELVEGSVVNELNKKLNEHTHGTITLSGDVTGSATIGSGTTAINITATVKDDSHNHSNYALTGHTHVSSEITDSISSSNGIRSSSTGLVQGKSVYEYAAPKSHATPDTTYGLSTDSNYGHVSLYNRDIARVTTVPDGVAAGLGHTHGNYALTGHTHSNYALTGHTHVSSEITDSISSSSGITSSATGLVQGKTVYEYAAPKSHEHNFYDFISLDHALPGTLSTTATEIGLVDKDVIIPVDNNILIGDTVKVIFRTITPGLSGTVFIGGFVTSTNEAQSKTYVLMKSITIDINGYIIMKYVGDFLFEILYNSYENKTENMSVDSATSAINATNATYAEYINISSTNNSSNYPIVFTSGVTAGDKTLYTDTVNSIYYNPNSNTLTVPTVSISSLTGSTTITCNQPLNLYNYSYCKGNFNIKGTDHNSESIQLMGGSKSSVAKIIVNGVSGSTLNRGEIVCGKLTYSDGALGTSDETLKDFVNDIEVDFDTLKQIPKKYFTWKYDDGKVMNIGTSAQEVEKIYPEIVGEYLDESTNIKYKSLDYSKLSIIALAAIDKLNERIEYLENKLNEYESR